MKTNDSNHFWPLSPQMATLLSVAFAVIFVMMTFAASAQTTEDTLSGESITTEVDETAHDEQGKSGEKGKDGEAYRRHADPGRYGQRGHRGPPRGHYEERGQYGPPRGQYERRGQYGPPRGQYERRGQYGSPRGQYERRGQYGSPRGQYERREQYGTPPRQYEGRGRNYEGADEGRYGPPHGQRRPPQHRRYDDAGDYRDSTPPQQHPDARRQTRRRPIEDTRTFKQMDLDNDGSITLEEFNRYQNRGTVDAPDV